MQGETVRGGLSGVRKNCHPLIRGKEIKYLILPFQLSKHYYYLKLKYMKKTFGMLKFSGSILDITQLNILRSISFH